MDIIETHDNTEKYVQELKRKGIPRFLKEGFDDRYCIFYRVLLQVMGLAIFAHIGTGELAWVYVWWTQSWDAAQNIYIQKIW